MPAAGREKSCTTTPDENNFGHERPGRCGRRQRIDHARPGADADPARAQGAIVLPAQTLGELFNVLVRKVNRRPARAREAVLSWCDAYAVVETPAAVIVNATDLATDHGLAIWDSVVPAASAEAECRLLLSEDLQEGFTWRGVTVTNPVCGNSSPE